MSKQHAPKAPEQQAPASQQAQASEVGGETAQAGLVGNGAMQERSQGAQGEGLEAEGSFAEGALDNVLEWTVEQIGSLEDLLRYLAEAGEAAAIAMVYQLAAHAPEILEELLATASAVDAVVWAAFEALGEVAVLLGLPAAAQALLLAEALRRGTAWVIDGLMAIDGQELLRLLGTLPDLELLLQEAEGLFLRALDAAWEPGLGLTIEVDLTAFAAFLAVDLGGTVSLRHQGQGAFEVVREVRAGGAVGASGGGDREDGTGEAVLELGAEGFLIESFEVPFQGWLEPLVFAQILTGVHVGSFAQLLGCEQLSGLDLTRYATMLQLGGGARLTGGVKASGGGNEEEEGEASDPLSFALAALATSGIEAQLELTEMKHNGAHVAFVGTIDALLKLGASLGVGTEELKVGMGVEDDVGLKSEGRVEADVRVDPEVDPLEWVANVTASRTDTLDLGDSEVEAGVELGVELGLITSVEEALDRLVALKVAARLGAGGEVAEQWLKQADLLGSLGGGTWALTAEIAFEASLGGDDLRFVAGAVADCLVKSVGEDGLVDALLTWAASPLKHTPVEAMELLAAELAMAADLELTITGEASVSGGVEAGDPVGGGVEAGAALDIEKDLLQMGASVTSTDLKALLAGKAAGPDTLELC